jgi:hypothetical protein
VLSDDCIISVLTDVNDEKQEQTERTGTKLLTYKCQKCNRNGTSLKRVMKRMGNTESYTLRCSSKSDNYKSSPCITYVFIQLLHISVFHAEFTYQYNNRLQWALLPPMPLQELRFFHPCFLILGSDVITFCMIWKLKK